MSTCGIWLYRDTRLLMLRQQRRVFFRRVIGCALALPLAAFAFGYLVG